MVTINGFSMNVNGISVTFTHKIAKYIESNDSVFVLLDIPNNDNSINNIYAISPDGTCKWQSEDLNIRFPDIQIKQPYLSMNLHGKEIWANDFMGRRFIINSDDGKVIGMSIAK